MFDRIHRKFSSWVGWVIVCLLAGWASSGWAEPPEQEDTPMLDLDAGETAEVAGLDGASVERVLAGELGAIHVCTAVSTPSGEDWAGQLTVRFALPPEGKVDAIEVEQNSAGEAAEDCVVSALRRVDLPRPDDRTVVVRRSFEISEMNERSRTSSGTSREVEGPDDEPNTILGSLRNTDRDAERDESESDGGSGVKKRRSAGGRDDEMEEAPDDEAEEVSGALRLNSAPKVSGSGELSNEKIEAVLERYMRRFVHCYERRLRQSSGAEGRVVVSFRIGRAGRVTKGELREDAVGGEVGQCVAEVTERLRFPRPNGGAVIVLQEFVFEPSSGEGVDASEESDE